MSFGEFIGSGSSVSKLILHMNGNSNDSSGNSLNGSDTNITYSKQYGKFNEGALFNGSSSKITLPSSTALDIYTFSHTTIMWVYIANYSQSAYQYYIFGTGSYGSSKTCCSCRIATNGKVEYFVSSNQDAQVDYFITTNTLPLNQWNCIIGVWGKPNRDIKLYLNGSIFAGTLTRVGASLPVYTSTTNVFIGAAHGTGNYGYFNGRMDEIVFESVIYSAVDAQKYYTYAKGLF